MLAIPENINVIWQPIPGSSQEIAIDSRCHHTLFCGTRGSAKTATQLMKYRRQVGLGYGAFWRGMILDKEFKNFSDLVTQSKRFFKAFDDGARFHESASEYKWVWPTGEELLFRHAKKISDYENFHGHEYPFLGWNELTKHATSDLYDRMMSTNRSSFVPEIHTPKNTDGTYATSNGLPLPPIPLEVFSTTNPSGAGHNWVKKRFITCAEYGEVVERKHIVFDPKLKKDVEVIKTQVALFGSYRENIYLTPEYIAELNELTKSNKNLYKAWVLGSWEVTAGGAIDDLWASECHILPRFKIPENWYLDRSFDWGSAHPFSVCWWAESNGEEVEIESGKTICFPKGTLIQIAEWYGTEEIGTNKGLKMSAKEVAEGIRDIEIKLLEEGWIEKQPYPGPADTRRGGNVDTTQDSIADIMLNHGIRWKEPNKSKHTRIQGLQLLRDRLEASLKGEGPGIYFMRNCQASIETLPALQRDEKEVDDVDTATEDHVYDAVRYRILESSFRFATKFKTKIPT